jgi:hypothetical protein
MITPSNGEHPDSPESAADDISTKSIGCDPESSLSFDIL